MPYNKKRKKETKEEPSPTKPDIITDPKLIEEYDKQTPWICPTEPEETYDDNLLKKDLLKKSAEAVGQESSILIAVCPNDPYKDINSEKRVHMRIINGRHRYKQVPNWKRQYILIKDFQEYCKYRLNYDIKKSSNSKELENVLKMQGRDLIEQGIPLEKIGSTLCKNLNGIRKQTILPLLHPEWKDSKKAANRQGKSKEKNGKNIEEKYQRKIDNLKAENQQLKNENQQLKNNNEYLKEYIKKSFLNKEIQEGSNSI